MPSAAGKRVLMVIASDKFRDEEYQKPRALLEAAGVKVTVACSKLAEATGMLGMKVRPDILLKDAEVDDYDGVVFVGGMGATEYWDNPTAHSLARLAHGAGKLTSAICLGPMTLANAGLLKGKKATIWKDAVADFKTKGVVYTGKPVERDGKIVTGSGPDAAEEFGKALLETLGRQD
ncbi:MAG: DJ-1/PfpI family protein [Candidatus Omnitrophica bacterium]|nr:DJ-1/PfpI family protein [Candidatus Omnitrophota bacterium]